MFQQASTHYEYNKQLQKPWCEGHWDRVIESCLLRFFGTRQCPSTVVMTLFSTVSLYPANRTLLVSSVCRSGIEFALVMHVVASPSHSPTNYLPFFLVWFIVLGWRRRF
jgi:hypothetical protein